MQQGKEIAFGMCTKCMSVCMYLRQKLRSCDKQCNRLPALKEPGKLTCKMEGTWKEKKGGSHFVMQS